MPLKYSLLLSVSLGLNAVLWGAYRGRMMKYKKLHEFTVYLGSIIIDNDIELTDFDQIAINQIVRNNASA